eukprot:6853257-Prorocentrum_lima.AAC.1
MTSSLVGSEMCIRDSRMPTLMMSMIIAILGRVMVPAIMMARRMAMLMICLLYTSDAADDM